MSTCIIIISCKYATTNMASRLKQMFVCCTRKMLLIYKSYDLNLSNIDNSDCSCQSVNQLQSSSQESIT